MSGAAYLTLVSGAAYLTLVSGTQGDTSPWHIDGQWFVNANGQRVIYKGCTDFRLFKRYLDGENLTPILEQRAQLGATVVRVLSTAVNLFDLPRGHYDRIGAFLDLVESFGLRAEMVALADCAHWSLVDQQDHVYQVGVAMADRRHLLELVNEWDVSYQHVDTSKFSKPADVLSSHGSPGSSGAIPQPFWDYVTVHPPRDGHWLRNLSKVIDDVQDGYSGFPGTYRPTIADEPKGFAEVVRSDRSADPQEAFECGARSALSGGGGTFHSDQGLQSELFTGTQLECARRFFQGASVWTLWR